jgi:hypothetical protein
MNLIFAVGLGLLTVPVIAHAIYRYADDSHNYESIALISDLTILYLEMLILSWQTFAGYLKCEDTTFCAAPVEKGVGNFLKSVDLVSFKKLMIKFSY